MRSDKKNASAEAINFPLLRKAGDPVINQVATPSQIREALEYLFNL
jgi:3-dehydroquinate synthetase